MYIVSVICPATSVAGLEALGLSIYDVRTPDTDLEVSHEDIPGDCRDKDLYCNGCLWQH